MSTLLLHGGTSSRLHAAVPETWRSTLRRLKLVYLKQVVTKMSGKMLNCHLGECSSQVGLENSTAVDERKES